MIYFYYGDNLYFLEEKLRIFQERYSEKFSSGLNFIKIDLEEDQIDKLREAIETYSMFEEKKLIFVRSSFSLKKDEWQKVEDIIDNDKLKKSEDVVLVFYEKEPSKELNKKSKKIFNFFTKNAKTEEFNLLKEVSLKKWIEKQVLKRDGKISFSATNFLVKRIGNNPLRLIKELEKLISFKNGEEITEKDIEFLVSSEIESNIFKTTDALAQKNKVKALESLQEHWSAGDDPMGILGMFIYQLRILILLKEASDKKEDTKSLEENFKIHPYVIKKNLSLAKQFSLEDLKKMYKFLAKADLEIKIGKKEPQEALEDFIIKSLT